MAEPDMGWHRVCLNTIVRKARGLDSERLRILPMGSRVNVVEKNGRRVRIDQPIAGWGSLNSSNGDTILKPLDPTSAQKVAPTPRGGQAAVSNLESKVAQKSAEIAKAKEGNVDTNELKKMEAQKKLLEARVADLIAENKQQMQTLQEFQTAADAAKEQTSTASGTAPTDMETIQFRIDDAAMLAKTALGLEGIVVVRAVKQDGDTELIGVDYEGSLDEDNPEVTAIKTDGEGLWKPRKNMQGLWLQRNHLKSVLPMYQMLLSLNKAQEEIKTLKYYKRSCEGMQAIAADFAKYYKECDQIIFEKPEKDTPVKMPGKTYAQKFAELFDQVEITG